MNDSFQIANIKEEYWLVINKARIIVNAFKHGEGKALEDARRVCPEVIHKEETETHHSLIEIKDNHLKELIRALIGFYEDLDKETKLYFETWRS